MKIHFATVEKANESDNSDYWSDTVCGIESENVLNDWQSVTCKKCLCRRERFEAELKQANIHALEEMNGFVEFINSLKQE